jgi:hypothetical protein
MNPFSTGVEKEASKTRQAAMDIKHKQHQIHPTT